MHSKAPSTNKKYDLYFHKFDKRRELVNFSSLLALPKTVFLLLGSLVHHYAINRKPELALLSNPCEDRIMKMTFEGPKCILSVPVKKKESMTIDILRKIVTFYNTMTLKSIRICTCVFWDFSFSGFFRYVRLLGFHMRDIRYSDSHTGSRVTSSETV